MNLDVRRNKIANGAVTAKALATGLVRATIVFDGTGALPTAMGTFEKATNNSTMLIFISGSGFHAAGSANIGAWLEVDGTDVADMSVYANQINIHMPFVPRLLQFPSTYYGTPAFDKGEHEVRLTAYTGTASDVNDRYTIAALEIPHS